MRTLIIAAALCGIVLLARKQAGNRQPLPMPPPTPRQYEDRLANDLQVALSYGHKPLWDATCEKCRKVGREDLPGQMREKFPEWAEWLDRA